MTADHPTPAERASSLTRLEAAALDAADELRAEVEALKAELARRDAALADLTRQRDEARAALTGIHQAVHGTSADRHKFPNGCADLVIEVQELIRERDPARMVMDLVHDRDNALAQLERQAPVIEAARAWRTRLGRNREVYVLGSVMGQHSRDLIAAVDALGPVDPEATDG